MAAQVKKRLKFVQHPTKKNCNLPREIDPIYTERFCPLQQLHFGSFGITVDRDRIHFASRRRWRVDFYL
jgi:hypothetical protein